MPSRARLRAAGAAALLGAALATGGCSLLSPSSATPTPGVATNPPGTPISGTVTGSAGAGASSSAAAQAGGVLTVLATLGLNMHSSPALSAKVVGTLAWGSTVTVVAYTANGGPWPHSTTPGAWYQVQGSSITGWIVADPDYTAAGNLSSINFPDKHIDGLLYPADWTYADDPGEVLLQPQTGSDRPSLAIRVAANLAGLGATGLPGYTPVSSDSKVVACGYTGTEVQYRAASGAVAQPTADAGGAQVTRLPDFVQFRATLSPSVAIDIEMNYATASDLTVFQDLLNSIRYPFPLCEAVPSATPTPS
jgi:hypothetical protein